MPNYTIKETALLLGCRIMTLYSMIYRKAVKPRVSFSGKKYFTAGDIQKLKEIVDINKSRNFGYYNKKKGKKTKITPIKIDLIELKKNLCVIFKDPKKLKNIQNKFDRLIEDIRETEDSVSFNAAGEILKRLRENNNKPITMDEIRRQTCECKLKKKKK